MRRNINPKMLCPISIGKNAMKHITTTKRSNTHEQFRGTQTYVCMVRGYEWG